MLKAPMLLAAVLVVCVASSADARRRHHHGYYGYGESAPTLDDGRRAQSQGQDRTQGQGQGSGQEQAQGQREGQPQDQSQNRAQHSVQDRRDYRVRERDDRRRASSLDEWRRSRDTRDLGQDRPQDLVRDRGEDRSRERYDRRRARYDEWRRDREDWTRRRDAERGDAALRPGRGGPFAAVVDKLVRICGQHGADLDNWPFDALERIAGADEGRRTALAALRENAKKAAERLAADCPPDVPAAPPATPSARLEAVEQGIDTTLAAFDTVGPALQSFYGVLDDEQKARLYRDMMAAPAAAARETTPRREAQDERRESKEESREYGSRRHRWRAYAAARETIGRAHERSDMRESRISLRSSGRRTGATAAALPWGATMCEELAGVLRNWPVREIERDVRLSSTQRVAFYELVTSSLKAADTLASACPAESALTPVGRMDAMRQRLAAVRAATAAIRPALVRFYEALDQGQKVRFAGMS
jgi:LTXXQ motif family protein